MLSNIHARDVSENITAESTSEEIALGVPQPDGHVSDTSDEVAPAQAGRRCSRWPDATPEFRELLVLIDLNLTLLLRVRGTP